MSGIKWSDFYSTNVPPASSSSNPITAIENDIFIKSSFFTEQQQPINAHNALIAETSFSKCFSQTTEGGAINFGAPNCNIILCIVCAADCFSKAGRHFGKMFTNQINQVNFSSFVRCPSGNGMNAFGAFTLLNGVQTVNNINSSNNQCFAEGGVICDMQKEGSRIMNVICADIDCIENRLFYVGLNVLVFSCTVARCNCLHNLIHFSGSGEIFGRNIIDCKANFSLGCNSGLAKAYDIYDNSGLKVNETNIILKRKLSRPILHPYQAIETFECWEGPLFEQTKNSIRIPKFSLLTLLFLT